ncbi:DUF559 domain-containing protein [Streptosporangium roseum]|uniref:DUF559 domain-containing protein n=1 Tax=Streptosporangium roseum TaxID=2001 RepID=UPI003327FCF2
MPSIYLAGKIGKNDWRATATNGYRSPDIGDAYDDLLAGRRPGPWPILTKAVLGVFDYAGPYFVACDHGCAHSPTPVCSCSRGCSGRNCDDSQWVTTHGTIGGCIVMAASLPTWLPAASASDGARTYAHEECLAAIQRADIVFAWLDDLTAYGTLVEIGYARALGKKLIVATNGEHEELWFAKWSATKYMPAYSDPLSALRDLADEYNDPTTSPIESSFWKAHKRQKQPALCDLVCQHPVLGGRYRIDFAIPDKKIGIELDGYTWHSSKEAFTKDRQRQRELEADGWRIIRFSGAEVNQDVDACVQQAAALIISFGVAPPSQLSTKTIRIPPPTKQ